MVLSGGTQSYRFPVDVTFIVMLRSLLSLRKWLFSSGNGEIMPDFASDHFVRLPRKPRGNPDFILASLCVCFVFFVGDWETARQHASHFSPLPTVADFLRGYAVQSLLPWSDV